MPGRGTVPQARGEGRVVWPDAAKAVCIVLVVLFHVSTKHYEQLSWGVPHRVEFGWSVLTTGLRPVRMPLFFLISGWFAARALRRPLREVVERRVALHYWVYLVWLLITTAVLALVPSFPAYRAEDVPDLLLGLVLGWTNLWYLYALPLYFLLARAALRLPVPVVLGLATVAALVADLPSMPSRGDTDGLLENFLFFSLGALTPLVARLEARGSLRVLAAGSGVYAVLIALAVKTATDQALLVSTVLGLLGAALGVVAFVQLGALLPVLSRRLARLGRHTLPVYVLHLPLLAGLDALVDRVDLRVQGAGALVLAGSYPLALTVLLVVLCLALQELLRRCGLSWLFALPRVRRTTSVPPRKPVAVH